MKRHVLLLGLSGSGKTTAGELAARQLGAPFIDIDKRVELERGRTVAEIFDREAESTFRNLERSAVQAAIAGPPAVIAPGAGWASHGDNLEALPKNVFTIYLSVTLAVAAARISGSSHRPLLVGDRRTLLATQLAAREPFYVRAHAAVDTEALTVEGVAHMVVELARKSAGW